MIRTALRRANRSFAFFILLGLLFIAGFVGSTFAYFDGEVDQTATYAGGYIGPPVTLTSLSVAGYGASFHWTPATQGLNAQALYGLDNGGSSSCPAFTDTTATYTSLATALVTTLATTTYAGTSTDNGNYYCYQVRSTHGGWYQGAVFAGIQVGLVPLTVALANANGTLANLDKITIAYNQTVTLGTTSAVTVMGCAAAGAGNGKVVIGSSSCSSAGSIGSISGLTMTGSTKTFTTSSIAGNSTKTITVTLSGGANTAATGSGTFTGSGTNAQSAIGSAVVCNCSVTPTGSF